MVTGEHQRAETMNQLNMVDDTEDTTVIRDHLEIFQTLIETFKKQGSMAI